MPSAEYRLFIDNQPLDREQLDLFTSVRVEQAMGMAAAAELELQLATDAKGSWQGFDEAWLTPLARLRVEVKVGEGDFQALIDGPVVGQRYSLEAAPDSSRLVLIVHDDSVLLDREERVKVFENQPLASLVAELIEEPGLSSRIAAGLPDAASALDRFIVQRGSNMQLLRLLARRFGMQVYVEPGAEPGQSVGVFESPEARDEGLPELVLLGEERNIASFQAEFDALRPQAPRAASVSASDKQTLTASASAAAADSSPLGEQPAHALSQPASTLLCHGREEQADLDAATSGVAQVSAWAYTAQAEVDNDLYSAVLRPYRRLRVVGVGPQLSGDYLIARVLHQLDDSGYRQSCSLSRNARSTAGASDGLAGLLAGAF